MVYLVVFFICCTLKCAAISQCKCQLNRCHLSNMSLMTRLSIERAHSIQTNCWVNAYLNAFSLFATIFIYWIEELKTKINLLSSIFALALAIKFGLLRSSASSSFFIFSECMCVFALTIWISRSVRFNFKICKT